MLSAEPNWGVRTLSRQVEHRQRRWENRSYKKGGDERGREMEFPDREEEEGGREAKQGSVGRWKEWKMAM